MRRVSGMLVLVALVGVLCHRFASATPLPGFSGNDSHAFSAQMFRRAFGETSALEGDLASADDSFFRTFAFRVNAVPVGTGSALVRIASDPIPPLATRLYAAPPPSPLPIAASSYRASALVPPESGSFETAGPVIGLYQDASAQPVTAPASFRFDLMRSTDYGSRLATLSPTLDPREAFAAGAAGPDAMMLPQAQASFALPMRVGHVRFAPHVAGAQSNVPGLALHDNAVNTGATFDTRVGAKKFNVDVSSGFEHLTMAEPQIDSSSFDATSNWQMSAGNLPVLLPAYANVSKRTLSAGVGVPLSPNLSVNVQAATQHLQGAYGAPGPDNLDATNAVYGGQVTFTLPHSSSAISLSAKQYRFQDNLVRNNTFTQTNADVNFTVKF